MAATGTEGAFVAGAGATLRVGNATKRPSKLTRHRKNATQSCARPPGKRVRLRRADTHHAHGWLWRGRRRAPRWPPRGLRRLLEAVWPDESDSALVARFARLGYVVLTALSQALQRSFAPSEKELVVEYGITEPNPADKFYVDPLRDWEPAGKAYYYDSFGKPVFLSANAPNGLAIALEFCDGFEEESDMESGPNCAAEEKAVDGERPQDEPPPKSHAGDSTCGGAL